MTTGTTRRPDREREFEERLRRAQDAASALKNPPRLIEASYQATLKDVLFERCDLQAAMFSGAALTRTELRRCILAGVQGVEALRGARMPWPDVVENGPVFAAGLGIAIID